MPRRAAMAVRWISAFVEPPIACSTTRALVIEAGVSSADGRGPCAASATARAPDASARRSRSACTAGIVAAPGSAMPTASAMHAIVLAVPITMHVPAVGARRSLTASISAASISPARNLPQ